MRSLFILCFSLLVGCSPPSGPDQITVRGEAFGTTYGVKYFGKGKEAFRVQRGIDSVVLAVNKSMSTYIRTSDISKINRGDSSVVVDDMFLEVFMLSRKLNKASKHYFDPTVGVLRNAYGFGDTNAIQTMDQATLDSLRQYVGWHKVNLKKDRTITKEHPEIYFDFNAIAKGYGIDRIAVYLETIGKANYLIEVGGEVRAQGKNIVADKFWRVGIEGVDSAIDNRSAIASVTLKNASMAGSGNYRKYRIDEHTSKKYVHTINPLTGAAEQIDILSAHVIAPTCAEADAWATAFMAMGVEKSKEVLVKQKDIEAYLTYDGGAYVTAGFKKMINK